MDAGEPDQGLHRQVGVCEARAGAVTAGRQRAPGVRPGHRRGAWRDGPGPSTARPARPGQPHRGPRLAGERLGGAPITACHRDHRPLAQRDRDCLSRLIACPLVTASRKNGSRFGGHRKKTHASPRKSSAPGLTRPRRRSPRMLLGVGAHLLDPVRGRTGAEQGGIRLGGRVYGPGGVLACQRSTISSHRWAWTGCPISGKGTSQRRAIGRALPPRSSSQWSHRCGVVRQPW